MADTETFIQTLELGPLDVLIQTLDAQPRRVNTFLSQPSPHGNEQWMPLHFAARAGNLAAVQVLLQRGVHPDCRTRFTTPMHARQTALHLAATAGHIAVLEGLLDGGAEVEVRDAQQRSPLWLAARHGHAEAVSHLTRHGADPEARDAQGRPALHAALLPPKSRAAEKTRSVIDQSPDRLISTPTLPFTPAAALALLDAGADPNATCPKDPAGFTALHRCVALGTSALPVAERLMKDGAAFAADPRHGQTPLDLAQQLGHNAYRHLFPTP